MLTKYRLSVIPKYETAHNPLHDELEDAIVTNVELTVGERGYFLAEFQDGSTHSISTSTVSTVEGFENGDIRLITRNTIYLFHKIS